MDDQEQHNRYDELARKLLDGTISSSEKQEYLNWLNQEEDALNIPAGFANDREELKTRMYNAVQSVMKEEASITRINRKRNWYFYAAAAAILFLVTGLATYLLVNRQQTPQTVAQRKSTKPVKTDVLPGRDGAILTLGNGQQLLLDSMGSGVIATQGNTNIKMRNGQLVYDVMQPGGEVLYNTMTTPKGRQYQLLLPDGSKVWMNAASSISYPTAFTGKERIVKVSGEVYFEVTTLRLRSGQKMPFIVQTGMQEVEVLGTHFNINAYEDEPAIKTTLLEGKVRVSAPDSYRGGNPQSAILKPGEQVSLSHLSHLSQPIPVQTEEVMAWKNGRFEFTGNSIQSVMRQIARWYDVDIVYEGAIPDVNLVGAIARKEKLSQVLNMLELTNVMQFKIQKKSAVGEASQVIVMRK